MDNKDTKNVWMSEEEIELIERHLEPHFSMLEYGCGGSTRLQKARVFGFPDTLF